MMKFRTACLVLLLSFSLSAWIEAGKGNGNGGGGGGGGGGKKSDSSTYAAEFSIVDENQDLVSDGQGVYSDQVDGVSAEIVGAGNPLLKLGNSEIRDAGVDLSGCEATEGHSLPQISAYILGISPYGMSVDGNFIGMTTGQIADTLLGIGLETPDDGIAWSLRFDPYFGSDLAEVERLSESSWEVRSLNRKAAIVRPTNKGNRKEVVATCNPFRLTYTVHCKEIDTSGACLPK